MNIYVIVEGKRTEKKVYPAWLQFLIPNLSRVYFANEAVVNNYYLFNGNGYPSLLHNHLRNSFSEVNDLDIYNYLVLILDVDESSIQNRVEEVTNFVNQQNLSLKDCELIVIPQNRCIETWFLGNRNIFKNNPQDTLLSNFIRFYNVSDNDPELMGKFEGYETHSQFHAEYAIRFLRERNIRYTKKNPNGVIEKRFLESLIERNRESNHIQSFYNFKLFCEKIKNEISQ